MEWVINFKRKGEPGEKMVIMPGTPKLLWWLIRNAFRCQEVIIFSVREEEQDV